MSKTSNHNHAIQDRKGGPNRHHPARTAAPFLFDSQWMEQHQISTLAHPHNISCPADQQCPCFPLPFKKGAGGWGKEQKPLSNTKWSWPKHQEPHNNQQGWTWNKASTWPTIMFPGVPPISSFSNATGLWRRKHFSKTSDHNYAILNRKKGPSPRAILS